MKGREYNDGLQQAIQAKEGVEIKSETTVLATITYQNFFRLYKKVSGMTGTAKTEEEEFEKIYNMRVIVIPTNRPIQRIDDVDIIYGTHKGKLEGLVKEVGERHAKGQPILIGTVSVESNEEISGLLSKAGIPHEVLNAKNQAREAEIISHAGEKGAVTLATNMAGRGTDIKLGEGVRELGGLCVFGTERHESRRIDNQLRGRSGRQGDPGYSRFYVSFDDELMRRFMNDEARVRMQKLLGDDHLENKMIQNMVTNAQKQIEGKNFDIRKNLLDYDDVLAKQRQIIYDRRDRIMLSGDIGDLIHDFFTEAGKFLAKKSTMPGRDEDLISAEILRKNVEPSFLPEGTLNAKAFDEATVEEGGEAITSSFVAKVTEPAPAERSEKAKEFDDKIANLTEQVNSFAGTLGEYTALEAEIGQLKEDINASLADTSVDVGSSDTELETITDSGTKSATETTTQPATKTTVEPTGEPTTSPTPEVVDRKGVSDNTAVFLGTGTNPAAIGGADSITLKSGESTTITSNVTGTSADPDHQESWKSDNEAVATVGYDLSDNKATSATVTGVSAGTATITHTYYTSKQVIIWTDWTKHSETIQVTVSAPEYNVTFSVGDDAATAGVAAPNAITVTGGQTISDWRRRTACKGLCRMVFG